VGGDSAGGNLSCALMALILKNKLLIPKGIFLIYPSLDLRKTIYYPSRQYTLIDPIIWPSLAVLVIDSYIKHKESADNPLISPLLLTEEFISGKEGDKAFPKQWPRTIIIVGLKDPLRDECLLLMERMTKSGIDCECRILQGFRHGFMNT
jgi:acetyl esterase/lipase